VHARPFLAAAAAAVAVLAPTAAAAPTFAGESTAAYTVDLTVRPNGTLHVVERIDYDFGDTPRHGIERFIPTRFRYDDTYDRVEPISHVTTTATDASAKVTQRQEGSFTRIRIGDPNKTITGRHLYTISYDVKGALNGFPDHIELYWNAIGDQWNTDISLASARVHAPDAITRVLCFVGRTGATTPCEGSSTSGSEATFTQSSGLPAYNGLTVVVELPKGSVSNTKPILKERFAVSRAFGASPKSLSLAALVLLGGGGLLGRLLWLRGRDRRYVGQIPGLTPAAGQADVEQPRPLTGTPLAGPVEFAPPDGIRPGQVGTLVDEQANPLDVTATIVDLAVRGYLRIEELPRQHRWSKADWKLVRLSPAPETSPRNPALLPYESTLLEALFAGRDEVLLSDLKDTFYAELKRVQDRLYDDVVQQGWFSRRPDAVRSAWKGAGIGITAVGAGLTYLLAKHTHLGLVGVAAVLVGLLVVSTAKLAPARTGKGGAELARVLGFRQYVATAEAGQLKFEEATDVFSRYLPYAVVFGLTERWAKAFGDIAAQQAAAGGLGWYVGPPGWNPLFFGTSFDSFTSTVGSAVVSTPAASGGSGFSGGGFSGGGGGGGGGGSW
jgi:hypothetical protein